MSKENNFEVRSLVGLNTNQPLVEARLGTERIQMTPRKAREIAGMIINCAESAETDMFIVDFLTKKLEIDLKDVVRFLDEFRQHRLVMDAQQKSHDEG